MDEDFEVDGIADSAQVVFDSVRAKLLLESDVFWARTSIGRELLALGLIPGLGTRKANRLSERLRTPQAIFRRSRSELEAAGLSGSVAPAPPIRRGDRLSNDRQQSMLESKPADAAEQQPAIR
jgi:hypothetical protein